MAIPSHKNIDICYNFSPCLFHEVILIDNKLTERRIRCNTCGHTYCYTAADLHNNEKLAKSAFRDSVVGLTGAMGGWIISSQIANASAENKLGRITDYSKCPKCNSRDIHELSDEEQENTPANVPISSPVPDVHPVSTADELKKFKELLDMGIITQEEFDTKKKQLLGL